MADQPCPTCNGEPQMCDDWRNCYSRCDVCDVPACPTCGGSTDPSDVGSCLGHGSGRVPADDVHAALDEMQRVSEEMGLYDDPSVPADECGEARDHDLKVTYEADDGRQWLCRRCGAELWEDPEEAHHG